MASPAERVITYTVIAAEMEGKVYLMSVYDKADFSTVDLSVLKEIVKISVKVYLDRGFFVSLKNLVNFAKKIKI